MTAIFSSKKDKGTVKKEKAPEKKVVVSEKDLSGVLIQPRITEKATFLSGRGVYVFEVLPLATKTEIKESIEKYYNVSPQKIRIVKSPSKIRFVRGKWGKTASGKKAYVYLEKGKTLEIM